MEFIAKLFSGISVYPSVGSWLGVGGQTAGSNLDLWLFLSHSVVDCGPPASVEDTELRSVTGTTYSSVATFVCDEGFVWRSGANSSVCGADGRWEGPNMVCEGNKTHVEKRRN